MAQNLSGSDKTFRRYAAVESFNHPPIHPDFQHAPPPGDARAPADSNTVTAVAATNLLTTSAHLLVIDERLRFTTTGALPAGLALATTYYVIASGLTADDFKVSATPGGSEVDITDAGTGVHSWQRYLTTDEQAQIDQWRFDRIDAAVTLDGAVIMMAAYKRYWADPKHKAWAIDDYLQREAQWKWRWADHMDAAQTATPPSASDTGTVTTPPPASPANPSPN